MTNRSVLIVTPYFAPQSHAAVFRAYKLAKYLPEYGWKPYVVTTDINYLYNEDPRLLDALPPEVEIHRARYIEPSVRGMRMALGGRDRTFKALKKDGAALASVSSHQFTSQQSVLRRFYQYMLEAWVKVPDAYWTWERPAIKLANELISRHQIPLVYTSAMPFTSHRIGYRLKRQHSLQWVADFRDPATHSYKMFSHHDHVFNRQRKTEKLAVKHADAITVLAESYALILSESYGLAGDHPVYFISTGLDGALLDNKPKGYKPFPYPYLLFVGEFVRAYDEEFFRLFAKAIQDPQVVATGIKLVFIGRIDVNAPVLLPVLRKYGLEEHAELMDHMPQEGVYHYLRSARAALLIPGRRALWWNLYAKLVDYLALRVPVIAIVPDPSEARTHLQRSGLGIFLDDNDDKAVEQLKQIICGDVCQQGINTSYCDQFLVKAQVERFVDLFQSLTATQLEKLLC